MAPNQHDVLGLVKLYDQENLRLFATSASGIHFVCCAWRLNVRRRHCFCFRKALFRQRRLFLKKQCVSLIRTGRNDNKGTIKASLLLHGSTNPTSEVSLDSSKRTSLAFTLLAKQELRTRSAYKIFSAKHAAQLYELSKERTSFPLRGAAKLELSW